MTTDSNRLNTVQRLYEYAQEHADVDIPICLRVSDIAALIWQAEANGVRAVSDRHNTVMGIIRERAAACRYHYMANAVIGEPGGYGDILYDSRYSEEFGDWDIAVSIPEVSNA